MDPQMVMSYSGDAGVGSISSWQKFWKNGVWKRGSFRKSIENKSVKTKLVYLKPMKMIQIAEISLVPSSIGTLVHWAVTGKNNFMGRLFCLFINMDKMVGKN